MLLPRKRNISVATPFVIYTNFFQCGETGDQFLSQMQGNKQNAIHYQELILFQQFIKYIYIIQTKKKLFIFR